MSKIIRYYQDSGVVYFSVLMVSFLAAASLLAFFVGSLTGWPFRRAFDVSYTSISIFFLLGGIGWMVVSRFRAGPVLLDIKAVHPMRGWLIVGAISYLFILSLDFDPGNIWLSLRSQMVFLLLVVYSVILALGRFQIRKRGVWLYVALIPWHRIRSYTLQDGVFGLQTEGLRLWAKEGYIVPEEHAEAFERYLLKHSVSEQQNTA